MTSTETKVNINELIGMASYEVIKGIVPEFDELKKRFRTHRGDDFLDEDLADHVGEPCYFIYDHCDCGVRACYLGDKCNKQMLMDIIDNLDVVVFDLTFPDVIYQIREQEGNETLIDILEGNQDYEELYNYVVAHNIDISDWQLSWLKVLGLNRQDLLEEM